MVDGSEPRLTLSAAATILLFAFATAGCDGGEPGTAGKRSNRLDVVATTPILGEVVDAVGGDDVELAVIVPRHADVHAYAASPSDIAMIERADVIFVSGFGYEAGLLGLMDPGAERVVSASEGIAPRVDWASHGRAPAGSEPGIENLTAGAAADFSGGGRHVAAPDPHVWLDPGNVARWATTVAGHLGQRDPARGDAYAARAEAYGKRMAELDRWIAERLSAVPEERRVLVTDHDALGWFADRYGFRVVGTVLPGSSTLAQASAGDLARLQETIRRLEVPAVFVSAPILGESLAARVAADAGVALVPLDIERLTGPGGPAPNYEAMMRRTVEAIASALEPDPASDIGRGAARRMRVGLGPVQGRARRAGSALALGA